MSKSDYEGQDPLDRARRRLLAQVIYVPPLVLGIISLEHSGCAPAPSCNPQSCNPNTQPCNPNIHPCPPNGGCTPHP